MSLFDAPRTAANRPYSTRRAGSGWTTARASSVYPATINNATASEYFDSFSPDSAPNAVAPEASSADTAESTISSCCECWLPIHATRIRLAPRDPTIAPTVFAAYTPPTSLAGSWPRAATAARARGKLAPQRIAAGRTVHSDRTMSNCIVNSGVFEIEGSIGQYGSDSMSIYAAHAIAAHSRTWHHASATRGLFNW